MTTAAEFEELYRATAGELFGYFRRRTGVDAEDLVAEVFTIAWRRRGDLPPEPLRRAWLFGVARKLLIADIRRSARAAAAAEDLATLSPDVADPVSRNAPVVAAALARLSPAEREIIELTEWERLTPAEVAVALGVRAGTARVRLHRARRALAADPELQALLGRRTNQHVDVSHTARLAEIADG
ncbi:DNA-directed RNA polymerase sigma-70 factor [Nocardioides phosphati]|uniref:DNA-directed RNA polymerase sigma-70 factor n=1 Tax=Nocardioides phosphati TaxID=1867775 RepID=A0ABQ2NDQ5_9ACTN|nr:sigma-70 family RNA polymerase sigma factor [Nocardioides phosphati]GGO91623.1 DNA-directed RNA polymerase sigma-70 factor [Nocardioides phosphati]